MDISNITSELNKNKCLLKHSHTKQEVKTEDLIPVTSENKAKYFPNAVKSEVELISKLGRKWRNNLGLIGSFVDLYQNVTRRDYYNNLYISTTSKRLLSVYQSSMTISRVRKLCEEVGLLYCWNEDYDFGHKHNHCKQYIYNKDVQDLVKLCVCKYDINIMRYIIHNNKHDNTYISLANTFESFKVKFSSKLRIAGVKNDDDVLPTLYENYPQFAHYQAVADSMNKDLPADQQISYTPNVNYSKCGYVTKIGIRATNSLCSLKVHENENTEYDGIWRDEYLDSYFNGKWYEFDVKSSIYRVAYLLKTGTWLDNDIDLYEMINGDKFKSAEDRNNFKAFCMRLYFDQPKQLFNHIKEAIPKAIESMGEDNIKDMLSTAKQNMTNIIGEGIDGEIFFHESNIYLEFVSKLRAMDLNVVQIYDGFFCDEDLTCYQDLLKNIAEDYYNRYIGE